MVNCEICICWLCCSMPQYLFDRQNVDVPVLVHQRGRRVAQFVGREFTTAEPCRFKAWDERDHNSVLIREAEDAGCAP